MPAVTLERLPLVLSLAIGCTVLGGAVGAHADVYKYVDDDGVIHYTNQKVTDPEGRYTSVVLLVEELGPANQAKAVPSSGSVLKYASHVEAAAAAHELDEALLHAVITVESGYNPKAVSPKGAVGLMQLMPATAKRLAVADPYDPQQNIQGGAKYLRQLLNMFDGSVELALAAYNAGEGAVRRYGGRIPPYRETLAYVPKVLKFYRLLKEGA